MLGNVIVAKFLEDIMKIFWLGHAKKWPGQKPNTYWSSMVDYN